MTPSIVEHAFGRKGLELPYVKSEPKMFILNNKQTELPHVH
jgi:hypothetical protein